MLFDTHTHLNDPDLYGSAASLIDEARAVGVTHMVVPGYDRDSSLRAMELADRFEGVYAAVGFHPHDAKDVTDQDLTELEQVWLKHPKVVAIGEIGLDYHYDNSPVEVQKKIFAAQIEIAKRVRKPIVIHDREAHADILTMLQTTQAREIGGIMHCYSASKEMAPQFLKENFLLSLGGPVTFKNGKKPAQVAEWIALDKLLIETDAPYLTPEPYRGKQNHPANVRFVAQKIADLRGVEVDVIEQATFTNALRIFGLEG
nr:TatD family hydrolase [Bacilli bacterium]